MNSKRNGLLEIYRFIFCFWPLYFHDFFFIQSDSVRFTVAELAVDFFFMLSGFFLMRAMQKIECKSIFRGMMKLMFGRIKPMLFTICFITVFNLICMALFIREDYMTVLHYVFRYWWFVLGLMIAVGLFYLVYRFLKSEKLFVAFLIFVVVAAACFHYAVNVKGLLHHNVIYFTRTYGCISFGILISKIAKIKVKGFNIAIPIVVLLVPTLFYLAYREKNFFICLVMIAMFGMLIYFSSNIPVYGKIYDLIGRLSVKIYLYMPFLTMLYVLGLTNNRILFLIDIALAVMNTVLEYYRDKYLSLKSKMTAE